MKISKFFHNKRRLLIISAVFLVFIGLAAVVTLKFAKFKADTANTVSFVKSSSFSYSNIDIINSQIKLAAGTGGANPTTQTVNGKADSVLKNDNNAWTDQANNSSSYIVGAIELANDTPTAKYAKTSSATSLWLKVSPDTAIPSNATNISLKVNAKIDSSNLKGITLAATSTSSYTNFVSQSFANQSTCSSGTPSATFTADYNNAAWTPDKINSNLWVMISYNTAACGGEVRLDQLSVSVTYTSYSNAYQTTGYIKQNNSVTSTLINSGNTNTLWKSVTINNYSTTNGTKIGLQLCAGNNSVGTEPSDCTTEMPISNDAGTSKIITFPYTPRGQYGQVRVMLYANTNAYTTPYLGSSVSVSYDAAVGGDFTFYATPNTQNINAGDSVDFNISASSVNNFASTLNISFSFNPSDKGVTALAIPAQLVLNANGSANGKVTIKTDNAATTTGTYGVRISASGGGKTYSKDVSVNVTNLNPAVCNQPSINTIEHGGLQMTSEVTVGEEYVLKGKDFRSNPGELKFYALDGNGYPLTTNVVSPSILRWSDTEIAFKLASNMNGKYKLKIKNVCGRESGYYPSSGEINVRYLEFSQTCAADGLPISLKLNLNSADYQSLASENVVTTYINYGYTEYNSDGSSFLSFRTIGNGSRSYDPNYRTISYNAKLTMADIANIYRGGGKFRVYINEKLHIGYYDIDFIGRFSTLEQTLPTTCAWKLPTITNFTPKNGGVNQVVTITGTNFGTIKGEVSFINKADENDKIAILATTNITSWTDTTITVKIPSNSAWSPDKNYRISVTNASSIGGVKTITPSDGPYFRYLASSSNCPNMSITGLSISSGKVGDGITIYGNGFGSVSYSKILRLKSLDNLVAAQADLSATGASWTNNAITTWIPNGVPVKSDYIWQIYDAAQDCVAQARPFEVVEGVNNACTAQITKVSPQSGVMGSELTINGTGFGSTPGSVILRDTNAAPHAPDTSLVVTSWQGDPTSPNVIKFRLIDKNTTTDNVIAPGKYTLIVTSGTCIYRIGFMINVDGNVWQPQGTDLNWSNPANWSKNVVPGPNDIAYFIGRNDNQKKSCNVDADVNIKALMVDSTYPLPLASTSLTGVINAANSSFHIIDFNLKGGWFIAPNTQCNASENTTLKCLYLMQTGSLANNNKATFKVNGGIFKSNYGEVLLVTDTLFGVTNFERSINLPSDQQLNSLSFIKTNSSIIQDVTTKITGSFVVNTNIRTHNTTTKAMVINELATKTRNIVFGLGNGPVKFGSIGKTVQVTNILSNRDPNTEIIGDIQYVDASQPGTVMGDNKFTGKFTCIEPGKTISFEKQKIQQIKGAFTIAGSATAPVKLKSTQDIQAGTCPLEAKIPIAECANNETPSCKMIANQWLLAALGQNSVNYADISTSYYIGWKDVNNDGKIDTGEDTITATNSEGDCYNRNWVNQEGISLANTISNIDRVANNWLGKLFSKAVASN